MCASLLRIRNIQKDDERRQGMTMELVYVTGRIERYQSLKFQRVISDVRLNGTKVRPWVFVNNFGKSDTYHNDNSSAIVGYSYNEVSTSARNIVNKSMQHKFMTFSSIINKIGYLV